MKTNIIFILFFAVVVGIIMSPLIFGGRILANLDTTSLFYPFFDFYHKAIINGESFLWNPLLFSGFPTYLSQSGGFFDPVNRLIFAFFDGVNGLHLRLFLDYFLVLVFSYFAGQAYGISRLASGIIGMAYLSSLHIIYISNPILANTIFLSPFLLWSFRKSIISTGLKRWFWVILGGLGLGWVLLSGNAQITLYILSLFALFTVIYFLFVWDGEKNFRSAAIFAGIIAAIVAVGILVGLPQILASAKHTPLTGRAGGLSYAITAGRNIGPWDFILLLFPNYLYFPYLSEGRYAMYIGAFMFFTAISALTVAAVKFKLFFKGVLSSEETHNIRTIILFAGVAIFALVAAFWKSPVSYVLQHLPVFKFFRYIDRWMFVGAFYWAVLGALGFDFFYKYSKEKFLKKIFNVIGIFIGAITALVLALNFFGEKFWNISAQLFYLIFSRVFYGRFGFNKDFRHYEDAIKRGIAAWQEFLSLGDFKFFLPFLILVIAFLVIYLFLRERVTQSNFKKIGFLLSVATFISVFAAYWPSNAISRNAIDSYDSLLKKFVPAEDRILYRAFPFMIQQGFAEFVAPGYKVKARDELAFTELKLASGWPDMNFFSGMASVDGYDPFVPRYLRETLEEIGSTHAGQDMTKKLQNNEIIDRLINNLDVLGMMSGKYIISGFKLDSPNLKFLGEEKVSNYNIPLYIYENLKAMPRFYYAKNVVPSSAKSLIDLLQNGAINFQEETYLDCEKCDIKEARGAYNLELTALKNGFIKFKTNTGSSKWLIVSESYLPGWTANIDGNAAEIVKANGLYMAIYVPDGEHEITLNYEGIFGEEKALKALGFMR